MKNAFDNEQKSYKLSIIVKHQKQILFIMLNPELLLKGKELFSCQFRKRFHNLEAIHVMEGNFIAQFPMSYFKQVSSILQQKHSCHVEYTIQLNELVFCSPV